MIGGFVGVLESFSQALGIAIVFLGAWAMANLIAICIRERHFTLSPLFEAISPLARAQKASPKDCGVPKDEEEGIAMLQYGSVEEPAQGPTVEEPEIEEVVAQ